MKAALGNYLNIKAGFFSMFDCSKPGPTYFGFSMGKKKKKKVNYFKSPFDQCFEIMSKSIIRKPGTGDVMFIFK